MNKIKYIIISLIILLLTACKHTATTDSTAFQIQNSNIPLSQNKADEADSPPSTMSVHFIDVGQGDCTLIESNGHYMLIDAGDNSKGTFIQLYLQKLGVTTLDYLILTHPDADHIGGADVVITKFNIEKIIMPDIKNDTRTYDDVIQVMKYKGYKNTLPIVGDEYQLGAAKFTIIAPNNYEYGDNTNDYSIGMLVQHEENRFLFVGDAEEAAKIDILENGIDISADVYKVAHHGSSSSAYEPFLNAVNPEYALISSGKDNVYEHPHISVLEWLREHNVRVYRTDEQGTVICTSDGQEVTWNAAHSETWKPGGTTALENTQEPSTETETIAHSDTNIQEYIINKNSKKFHYPDCNGVKTMSDKNKMSTTKTRDELIEAGYSPCGMCKP